MITNAHKEALPGATANLNLNDEFRMTSTSVRPPNASDWSAKAMRLYEALLDQKVLKVRAARAYQRSIPIVFGASQARRNSKAFKPIQTTFFKNFAKPHGPLGQ